MPDPVLCNALCSFVAHMQGLTVATEEYSEAADAATVQRALESYPTQYYLAAQGGSGARKPMPPTFYMTAYRRFAAEMLR